MSIATKTGDNGDTSLMFGRRVSKTDPRVDAYGSVDELSAALGTARVQTDDPFIAGELLAIQKELIIVMGELATAVEDRVRYQREGFHFTSAEMVERLTAAVDHLEKEKLVKYKGWAIPGTTRSGAALDVARTVCRRAERRIASLAEHGPQLNREVLRYLNRLSDLCWLLARYAEHRAENSAATA